MDFERIPAIAQQLGFNDQELTTLLMNLKPNPLVCRRGVMEANIYRVIETLDVNGIVIPNDNRMTTRTRIGEPGPLLPPNSQPLLITAGPASDVVHDAYESNMEHPPEGGPVGQEQHGHPAPESNMSRGRKNRR